MNRPLRVHVVSHTHWDREWYHPAGRFRVRLSELIDELLDIRSSAPFLLDGQAIVLEDYLAVRPERRAELSERLRAGALEAGPWYVLPDELIPSGESLVRNLLAGRRVLRALRATPPPVLYSPDAFGHPAALPLLAAGFGCPLTIVWRGLGGSRWPKGDTFRWVAPDGRTTTLVHHLAPDGYELGSSLPADENAARERWCQIRGALAPRARLPIVLLPNGADHHARQRSLEPALAALARAAHPDVVTSGTLAGFAAAAVEEAPADLPVISGELRDSYGYTWTLQGTFGTRAHQKRRNATAERLLVRDCEPWAALAALNGRSRRHLVAAAWQTLLQCHPHDTLCGCSIDEVSRAMDARLDDAVAQGEEIRDHCVEALAGHDRVAAAENPDAWHPAVLVRNAAARVRGGVVQLAIATELRREPVGPGSDRQAPNATGPGAEWDLSLDGGSAPVQVQRHTAGRARVESPVHYPRNYRATVTDALAWIPPLPGYGTRVLSVTRGTGSPPPPSPVHRTDTGWLDNGLLSVRISAEGSVELAAPRHQFRHASVISFEDVGDRGDLYTHSPVGPIVRVECALPTDRTAVESGPLRSSVTSWWRVPISSGGIARGTSPVAPDGTRRQIDVRVTATVDAEAPFVVFEVEGENVATDHRLRIVFATALSQGEVFADAAFGPVRRDPVVAVPADHAMETAPPTAPLHRYVSLFGSERGLTVFSDGLAEYEARPTGEIAVTLLRAVGELSRNDLPERPGHAGWPVATPAAQSLGPFRARFALMPHGIRNPATLDAIERAADDFLVPLVGTAFPSAMRTGGVTSGVQLDGPGLAFSAFKQSDDGEWIVARCVNLTDVRVRGSWTLSTPLREARLARLDETPLDAVPVQDEHIVSFDAAPRAVVTVLVR